MANQYVCDLTGDTISDGDERIELTVATYGAEREVDAPDGSRVKVRDSGGVRTFHLKKAEGEKLLAPILKRLPS